MVQKKVRTPIKIIKKGEVPQGTHRQVDFRNYLNVFDFSTILPGSKEKIKFKPLTVGNIKKLLTFNIDSDPEKIDTSQVTKMFDSIFVNSVISENFDPDNLYLQDRYHLLLEIRKKTKGETTQYQLSCPKCKSQSIQKIDFEQLEVKELEPKDNNVVLTNELSVQMRHLKRFHEKEIYELWNEISQEQTFESKSIENAELAMFLEAQQIDKIITPEGPQENITIYDKKYLLENLPQPIYKKIQDWQEENEFGPVMEIIIKCPHCVFSAKQNMMDLNFF